MTYIIGKWFHLRSEGAQIRIGRGARIVSIACATLAVVSAGFAQIGGRTAADGPFMLDDAEDLDLVADGVARNWISDYVAGVATPLQAVNPASKGLTTAVGQTSNGCLQFTGKVSYGYLSKGFGVPMPGVAGASTLSSPGNITSFTHFSFLACLSGSLPDQEFMVILETYPGPTYPKLYYKFTPASGNTFQRVTINLRQPSLVENAGSLTVDQLLAQTRYLSFYIYGGPSYVPRTIVLSVDDIRLTNGEYVPPATSFASYKLLSVRAGGSGYQEMFYNYSTGASYVYPYQSTDGRISYTVPLGQWVGMYHYDYATGRFSQAVYNTRQQM